MTHAVCRASSNIYLASTDNSRLGSGQSKHRGGEQSLESMAEDVEELMKHLKLDSSRTILVGHSMGGMVACRVASRLNHLRGLVLIGPVHPSPTLGDVFTKRMHTVMESQSFPNCYPPPQGRTNNSHSGGMEPLADSIPISATGSKATSTQRAFIRALILSQEPQGYASLCSVISKAEAPDYSAIKCPLLIVAGGDDKTCPLPSSEMILQR